MRRREVLPALGAGAISAQAQTASFALQFRESFLAHWQVERGYTLAVAEAMAASDYDSKPHPAQRTFGEQLIHLGMANVAYFSSYGLIPAPARPSGADKEAVKNYIAASFDYVTNVLQKLGEKDMVRKDAGTLRSKPHSTIDLCLRAYTHTAHHRGQAIVYLRVKGITPPTWAFEPSA